MNTVIACSPDDRMSEAKPASASALSSTPWSGYSSSTIRIAGGSDMSAFGSPAIRRGTQDSKCCSYTTGMCTFVGEHRSSAVQSEQRFKKVSWMFLQRAKLTIVDSTTTQKEEE